jgi:5'-3' exonuclease
MGIPSYFSHIIKNHTQVIKKNILKNNGIFFSRLYMDCNSILYDAYHDIFSKNGNENKKEDEIYQLILEKTIAKIENYIHVLKPTDIIYIAFDGPAPIAKMEQQRNRRYKSWFQTTYSNNTDEKKPLTSIFTPGTLFMQKLCIVMKQAFNGKEKEMKYNVQKIILAIPDEPGEGEHKLYQHLRENPEQKNNIAIYGLDADLIMLSIFHLSYTNNIFIFREAPEFMKSSITIDTHIKPNTKELWGLDIAQLGRSISNDMACAYPDNHRMYDYVFLCFLLGNDFLPHFPALNIRTYGIQRLLDTYRITIGNRPYSFLLSKTMEIQWKEVSILFSSLAKNEYSFIKDEYAFRKKWDYLQNKIDRIDSLSFCSKDKDKDNDNDNKDKEKQKEKEDLIESVPVIFRQDEKYICPSEIGWEKRYYSRLFSMEIEINDICINYLEGLEWVCKYYISGCPDWKWKYKYMYPPLLSDLSPKVPHYKVDFFSNQTKNNKSSVSVSPYVQLAYVLPRNQLILLLPKRQHELLLTKYGHLYPEGNNLKFKWAFCRYLWESHICLPEISLEILEKWEKELN